MFVRFVYIYFFKYQLVRAIELTIKPKVKDYN